jgi:hypothetical protein
MALAAWCERTNTHVTTKFLLKPRTGLCETDQFWIVATSADPPLFDRPPGWGMRPKAYDPLTVAERGICGPRAPVIAARRRLRHWRDDARRGTVKV